MERNAYKTEIYRGYLIRISYDDNAESPREWSNICKMNCYHRGYSLGDNKCKGDPWDDLRQIIVEEIDPKEFIKLVKEHCKSIKITHNNRSYFLYEYYDDVYHIYDEYPIDNRYTLGTLLSNAVTLMDDYELFGIIDNCSTVAISNLYAYIHSGITISMSRSGQYADRFDSGCLGFIYVTKKEILDNWKNLTDDTWKDKAYEIMAQEVKVYDNWLTGECFGWEVCAPINYEDDCEDEPTEWEDFPDDSCWGYIGTDEIEYMISEAKDVIDATIEKLEAEKQRAAEELARRKNVLNDNLQSIVGQRYVVGGELYEINRDNLMEYPQVVQYPVNKGQVDYWGIPVNIGDLDESVVDVLYNSISIPA